MRSASRTKRALRNEGTSSRTANLREPRRACKTCLPDASSISVPPPTRTTAPSPHDSLVQTLFSGVEAASLVRDFAAYENERSNSASMASRPLSSRKRVPVPVKCGCVITGPEFGLHFSPVHSNQPSCSWSKT